MQRLLTLREVLELTRVSYPTIRRWMNAGTFPQSISGKGKRLLWTPSAIELWMNRQSESVSIPIVTTPRKQRQAEKSYRERQEAARAALERHRRAK